MKKLMSVQDWKEFKNNIPNNSEVIIFKYSPLCSISYSVEQMFESWYNDISTDIKLDCIKIDVISARPLSQYIAQELDIRHQSPQLIWLAPDGRIKWFGSHYDIKEVALNKNLDK